MSDDIIERLRFKPPTHFGMTGSEKHVLGRLQDLMDEAANDIEGLRAQIRNLEQEEKEAYALGFKNGSQEKKELNKHGFQEYRCIECDWSWTGVKDSTCPNCVSGE